MAEITRNMQSRRVVGQVIGPILKLALLYQHGGILLNQPDLYFLGDDLHWLEDLFNSNS